MERIYQKESIKIYFPTNIEDGSSLPLTFVLRKGDFTIRSHIDAKPDQLHIRKVFMSHSNKGGGMTDFGEYFKSLGITSKTIRFLYDRLGNLRKNASGASHQLDGIPFDFMEEYPEGGSIFLKRKTDDEIVNVLAMPVLTTDELDESLKFIYNDSFIYVDFDIPVGGDDGGGMINEEEADGENSEFGEVEVDNSESIVEEVNQEHRVPGLSLLAKIQYGNDLDRCLEFVAHASPNHDHIFINGISFRKARKSGQAVGLNHLDEFEDFFRKRGVEPGNFNFLFDYVPKLNQMNNDCLNW